MIDIDDTILKVIDNDEEIKKGYVRNYKNFHKLVKEFDFNVEREVITLFKMCFSLGLFKCYTNDSYNAIKCVLKRYPDVLNSFDGILLSAYKIGFKELFFEFVNDDLASFLEMDFSYLYNNYEMIKKQIIKAHEQVVSDVNTMIKKGRQKNIDVSDLEVKLADLKRCIKHVTKEDVLIYFDKRTLNVDETLTKVSDTLLSYVNKEEFEKLKNLYSKSKGVKKSLSFPEDKKEGVHYKWLKSDDPLNLILGYEVKCCAKMGGMGYDIMVQSMINKDITNLVVFSNDEIIAKATAYYNPNKKYVLFNNAEVRLTSGLKANAKRRREAFDALLRAVNDFVKYSDENDIKISEVRMGLERNSLLPLIKRFGFMIVHDNLLENYHYDGYVGDASSELGQAILYRDNDFKNMII